MRLARRGRSSLDTECTGVKPFLPRNAERDGSDDEIPKSTCGRIAGDGERRGVLLSVDVHHALVDGLHVGRLVEGLEQALADPARSLGAAPP